MANNYHNTNILYDNISCPISHEILALRPELRDFTNYLTSITNAGIITRNEARQEIRKDPRTEEDFADELILPANIAGSAEDPSIGGRPSNSGDNNDDEE